MRLTNMNSRLLAIFGLLLIFSVNGWAVSISKQSFDTVANASAGTSIGTVTASGENNFAITNNPSNLFAISSSGDLSVASGQTLSSTAISYTLTVRAYNNGSVDSATITVNVLDSKLTCPGQKFVNLDGTTANAIDSGGGSILHGTTQYYSFTPAVNGTIRVQSTDQYGSNVLSVTSGCGGSMLATRSGSANEDTGTINITAGVLVVVAYQNTYTANSRNYALALTFTTTTSVPTMNVQGNSTTISDNDTTPSTTDGTDFGNVATNATASQTFTIQNTGTAALTIGAITFSGGNTGDFTVTSAPASSVAVNSSTQFTVIFTPGAASDRSTTINIVNNDSTKGTYYNFALKGTGTTAPTSNFSITGDSIDEGDSGPSSLPFIVTLSGLTCTNSLQTFTVGYATSDGTAEHSNTSPTDDYISKTGTLTFAVQSQNDNNKCIVKDGNGNKLKDTSNHNIRISSSNDTVYQTLNVSVNGDTVPEADETMKVTLSNPTNNSGITTAVGTGTILNDDITDLTMTKSASPTSVAVGGTITYTLQANYTGSTATSGSIKITDPLSSFGLTYVSGSGNNWSCTGSSTLTCTYNHTLNSGSQSSVLTIQAKAPNTASTVDNNATASYTGTETDTTNNSAHAPVTVLSSQADMVLSKTATASVAPSGTITYTLKGTNNGNSSAAGIKIIDTLPAGVTYVSKSGTSWGTCTATGQVSSGQTVTCLYSSSATISAGGSTNNLTISAKAPSTTGPITNNATISTTSTESSTTNNSASAPTTVSSAPVSYTTDNPRIFDIIYTTNTNGDIKMIGNTVLCKDDGNGNCIAPDPTKPNNSTNTLFYTLASDSSDSAIFNSSSYDLTLPVNGSNVLWAGLYWQGEYKGAPSNTWMSDAQNVKLKAPGDTTYRDLTAETNNNRFNWMVSGGSYNSSGYLYYQGVRDITSIVQGAGNGTYQVANVQTSYGSNYSPGHFGGWAIVLVYKDLTASLKNMVVYDGFSAVDTSHSLNITATGFLTPSSGLVDSKFTIFATEGDISYTADKITLSNSSGQDTPLYNPGNTNQNNPFNSSITDETGTPITTRNPNYANMIGVDIHTYDVGTAGTNPFNILGAGQTLTNIKLSTGNDVFNPGAFAFSTQLYIPDVCYLEDVYDHNELISSVNIPQQNDNVTYKVSITNKNYEPAKGVFIEKVFDKPREITYVPNSISIDTVAKTDGIGDDTAEFSTDTNTSKYLLGVGAMTGAGGTIAKDFLTKFTYQAKIGSQDASENTYLVSYRNDQLGVTFNGIPIRKCVDFNNSFVIGGVAGAFNAVPTTFSGTNDPLSRTDPLNALTTQVSNKSFSVKIVSLDSDKVTLKSYTGDVNVSIINTPNYIAGDDAGNQALCDNSTSFLTGIQTVHFNNNSFNTLAVANTPVATKNASFKMQFIAGATQKYVCSRDIFAIRPNEFNSTITANQIFIAEHNASLTFRANKDAGTGTTGYNEIVNTSFAVDLNISDSSKTCTNKNILFTPNIIFVDGIATGNYALNNVGNFNLTIHEINGSEFARVDATDTNDSARLITPFQTQIKVIPDHFLVERNLINAGTGFTYFSNFDAYPDGLSRNMSAALEMNITAKGENNTTLSNYSSLCYAKDGNITMTLNNALISNPAGNLAKLLWYESLHDHNGSVALPIATNFLIDLNATDFNSTTNGTATVKYLINFDRNQSLSVNPLLLSIHDVNRTDTDSRFGNKILDQNATFVYGRTHAPRYRFVGTDGNASIFYEVFCDGAGCTKSLLPNGTDSNSSDDPRWFKNSLHDVTANGVAGTVAQKGGAGLVSSLPLVDNIGQSRAPLTYNATKGYPYKTTMENNASSWLIYNKYKAAAATNEFEVEFSKATGDWAGVHETNTSIDYNGTNKTNRRTMW